MRRKKMNPKELRESLTEMILAAEFCISYSKAPPMWPRHRKGCLGYPGALLLLCIIDAIGAYFRFKGGYFVTIEGETVSLTKTDQHFFVLNGGYFNQNLSKDFLDALYNKLRATLTHNASIGNEILMMPGARSQIAFDSIRNSGKGKYTVKMYPLFSLCKAAVGQFLDDIKVT